MHAFHKSSATASNNNQISSYQNTRLQKEIPQIEEILLKDFSELQGGNKGSEFACPPGKVLFSRNNYAQTHYALSLVKDPLWKRVCGEILHLMGPIAAQLFQVQLGVPQDKTMDLYCQTEDMLPFLHTYQFVILGALQKYFPFLQTLKIIHTA